MCGIRLQGCSVCGAAYLYVGKCPYCRLAATESLLLRWHKEADSGKLDGVDLELMVATDNYVMEHGLDAQDGGGS